jgi:hypothetical protein
MTVHDWVGLGVIVIVTICAAIGLSQISKPYDASVEEFEKRASEGTSALGAGLIALQELLDPAVEKAVAVQQDFREEHLDGEQESGEGNDS